MRLVTRLVLAAPGAVVAVTYAYLLRRCAQFDVDRHSQAQRDYDNLLY